MSRYRDTRCRTEQGWGSRSGQDTSAASGGRGRAEQPEDPRGGGAGQQPGVPQLTWLSRPQREALVRVQAQRLAELLDVAGCILGQD